MSKVGGGGGGSGGTLKLLRDKTLYEQKSPEYVNVQYAAHMARVGAYISRSQFFVFDRDANLAEPMVFSVDVDTSTFDTGGVASPATGYLRGIAYGNSIYMACSSDGTCWSSPDGVTWASVTSPGVNGWDIAYGNGTWIVVGDSGAVYYSTDDGATWSAGSNPAAQNLKGVSYDARNDIFYAIGDDLIKSVDGGVNWTEIDGTAGISECYDIVPSQVTDVIVGIADSHVTAIGGSTGGIFSLDDGASFTVIPDGFPSNLPGAYVQAVAVDDTGLFVAVTTNNGTVYASSDGAHWSVMATLGVGLRGVMFDPSDGSWYACGENGHVYQSTTLASWTAYSAFGGETTTAQLWDMATDGSGQIVAVGAGGTVIATKSAQGLTSGAFTIHTIAYFPTEAGKFVFSYHQNVVNFSEDAGNVITVKVSSKSKIKTDTTAWPVSDALLANCKVDVYLEYKADQPANTSQTTSTFTDVASPEVIRYCFTADLPAGSDDLLTVGSDIKELPLGKPLGNNKGMTTIVFDDAETGVYLGRLFGMASQDETRWASYDGVSLQIANESADFVLGYTESGWANFMRPDNYLILQPSQSSQFTGIVATPSGVMCMFDSEIIVVNGDPDVGGFGVQTFPDVVGNDPGCQPTLLGGVPIVIWGGQIYALSGGQAQPLSQPVYRADDPFVRVVAEPQTRCLLATSESGRTFRYFFEYKFWMDDPLGVATSELLPNIPDGDVGDHTRAVNSTGDVVTTLTDGRPDTPSMEWDGVDFGVGALKGKAEMLTAGRRHTLYRARFLIPGLTVITDRNDGSYDASLVPRLYYKVTSHESEVSDPASTDFALGVMSEERLAFRLPMGLKSRLSDLRLELRSMDYDSIFRPPMEWFYALTDKVS